MLMPGTPRSAAAELIRMQVAFALAVTPAAFGTAVVLAFGSRHAVSYWWLALSLGWNVVPLSVYLRMQRFMRRVRSARLPGERAAGLT
jgi:hypothetical protein